MVDTREIDLENNSALYALLSSLFLTLPDEKLIDSVFAGSIAPDTDSRGCNEIACFAREQANRDRADVLADVARDRVRLMRGVNSEGIRPPYESLYAGYPAHETIGSLNEFYKSFGLEPSDQIKDASDHIGVEFAFMKLLFERELAATHSGDGAEADRIRLVRESFQSQHLGRWAHAYAEEMAQAAQTGLYRGIAFLILEAA